MKRLALSVIVMTCMITPAYCIDFWHSKTLWANQGECVAIFTFDSFMEDVDKMQLSVVALDKSGKKVSSGVIEVDSMGGGARRYVDGILEADGLCQDNLTIVVKKAHAVIGGKKVDLIKAKKISSREFKPFNIRIGK